MVNVGKLTMILYIQSTWFLGKRRLGYSQDGSLTCSLNPKLYLLKVLSEHIMPSIFHLPPSPHVYPSTLLYSSPCHGKVKYMGHMKDFPCRFLVVSANSEPKKVIGWRQDGEMRVFIPFIPSYRNCFQLAVCAWIKCHCFFQGCQTYTTCDRFSSSEGIRNLSVNLVLNPG